MALLPTSGTYNFQSIQIELLIREAFENIGIFGEFVESQKLDSAKRSIDLLMLEWMSKSVNLWTLEYDYMPLVTSQAQYTLPEPISDIVQINLRTSTRQLNGTPASSAGNAAYAFDGNPNTYCDAGVNGNISYDYGAGVTQQINFVGITSQTTTLYTLLVESSSDTMAWTTLFTIPAQTFTAGINVWFDILTPINTRAYRIRETNGSTLSIQELYFNNNIYDMPISEVSREEYFTYPNKQLQGRPSVYYINRLITPILYIWPVPNSYYNCIQVNYKEMIQDAGNYTNTLQIPARFYPALVNGLSWKLAIKFNPQMAQMFQAEYEKSFNIATVEDSENTPISIRGDTTYDYGR
jgi:hypothetical protein